MRTSHANAESARFGTALGWVRMQKRSPRSTLARPAVEGAPLCLRPLLPSFRPRNSRTRGSLISSSGVTASSGRSSPPLSASPPCFSRAWCVRKTASRSGDRADERSSLLEGLRSRRTSAPPHRALRGVGRSATRGAGRTSLRSDLRHAKVQTPSAPLDGPREIMFTARADRRRPDSRRETMSPSTAS